MKELLDKIKLYEKYIELSNLKQDFKNFINEENKKD